MAPFRRGKAGALTIRVLTGPGSKQLATGTTDMALAKRLDRMCKQLADEKEWDLLRALVEQPPRLTIDRLWDAYGKRALASLRAELAAVRLADFKDGWLADAKRNAPAAWPDQERAVDSFLTRFTFAHELTPGAVRDALNAQSGQASTRRAKLYAFSSYCRYLVAHHVLPSNPCADGDLVPRPAKAKKRTVWRTADVDKRIIDRLDGEARIVALVCAGSSADRATPMRMTVGDLQLLPVGTEPNAKRGLEHRVNLPGTKTEGRARKGVRLEPWVVPALREWITNKHPSTPLVSPTLRGKLVSDHWKLAAEAEREAGYWFRDLRHSYGCRALLAGYSLWEISKWLGHKSLAMTADIYLQFDYEIARLVQQSISQGTHDDADANADSGATRGATRPQLFNGTENR